MGLPPGRQGNPEVKKAAEIYVTLYAAKRLPGNWHELAKRLVPDYAGPSVEMQRYHRFRLRLQTHRYLYDQRSRLSEAICLMVCPSTPKKSRCQAYTQQRSSWSTAKRIS